MNVTLGSETIPGVIIAMSAAELPSGQAWTLEASYTDGVGQTVTYRPRGGSGAGTGAQVVLVDYAAPIRTPVTYTLRSATTATASVTRTSATADALTNLTGSVVAPVHRLPNDERQGTRRAHASDVPGNPYQPLRLAPVAGKGGGKLDVVTVGAQATALRALLDSNRLIYVLHAPDDDDDTPLVELVYITADGNVKATTRAPRFWSLSYVLASDPEPDLIMGLSSWTEFDARWAGSTWADFDAAMAGETWGDFDLIDWSSFA